MRDDLTLLLSNWLSDTNDVSGVNALIPAVELRADDPKLEPIVRVMSDITDDRIAMGKELLDGDHPALVLNVAQIELRPLGGDSNLSSAPNFAFSITYVHRIELGSRAFVAGGYIVELVRRSLSALNSASQDRRRVRSTQLAEITALAEARGHAAIGRSSLVATVFGRARAYDLRQD